MSAATYSSARPAGVGPRSRPWGQRRRWQVLSDLALEHHWRLMAELGVFKGETAEWLLERVPWLQIIGVDTWRPGDPDQDVAEVVKKTDLDTGYRSYVQHPLEEYHARCVRLAERSDGHLVLMRMTTYEAALHVADGTLDAVFIDADHRPDAVEQDIRDWTPKLKPSGWLCGHDLDLPGLGKRVISLLPGVRAFEDSVWAIPRAEIRL